MPEFIANYTGPTTELRHVWEHTVGSGHAALALRADWQRQLEQCHRELGFQRVRFHGLLSFPMDTLIFQSDRWIYSFFDCDQIFDYLLSIGMQPFVELSFMPDDLASGSKTAFHYRANVTQPKDYQKWSAFIRKLVQHWVDRYGIVEVRQWFFEVWNEPNLDVFGSGKKEDYFKIYSATVEAVKSVDPALSVGGPATAKSEWVGDFVEFVESKGLPADFISTHQYPTDAFGKPGDDTREQLSRSRRGIMRETAQDVKRESGDRPLLYTEWNTSSNPRDLLHDEPFAAAFTCTILMDVDDIVDAYAWWTFSDIFSENYMPSVPFQGGFGLLNIHGVAKPVYRAFELLHSLGTSRLRVDGIHETVSAWFIRDSEGDIRILLANHALPEHPITDEVVTLTLSDAPPPVSASVRLIDDSHANAKAKWKELGEPEYPTPTQLEQLHVASRMVAEPLSFSYQKREVGMKLSLMPHCTACISLHFEASLNE